MIITAKNDTSAVKNRLYAPITSAVFFRFISLGCSISRLIWASDSSPLMASTEWPNPTSIMIERNLLRPRAQQPSQSFLIAGMSAGEGSGGSCAPVLTIVIRHQTISITTITVVIFMICSARSLDSWMPLSVLPPEVNRHRDRKARAQTALSGM